LPELDRALTQYINDLNYSKQYTTIGRTSHVRSGARFGAPGLVQHIAFWPRNQVDPASFPIADLVGPEFRPKAHKQYHQRREELIKDVNRLLKKLQDLGRVKKTGDRYRIEKFELKPPADWKGAQSPVNVPTVESITFTIWWADAVGQTGLGTTVPADHLRVRVQADIYADFATVTFIIDAGERWNLETYPSSADPIKVDGTRRKRIFQAAADVRAISEGRLIKPCANALDVLPETDLTADEAMKLEAAAKLLYVTIWDEFADTFLDDPKKTKTEFEKSGRDLGLWSIVGKTDKAFAHFTGVVLAAPVEADATAKHGALARFAPRNDLTSLYPNKLIKAYWPFIRRTRPEADDRDWIACGVFDFRALYVTSLGGQSDHYPGDEMDASPISGAGPGATMDVPLGHLPERRLVPEHLVPSKVQEALEALANSTPAVDLPKLEKLRDRVADWPTTEEGDRPAPYRYLFLTAGEPHRKQVGRMVDRVNQLGTLRLFALKNYSIVRDADVHVRLYGQLLDEVMKQGTAKDMELHKAWAAKAAAEAIATLSSKDITEAAKKIEKQAPTLVGDLASLLQQLTAGAAQPNQVERLLTEFRWLLEDGTEAAANVDDPVHQGAS
jgi:hypothetical protein